MQVIKTSGAESKYHGSGAVTMPCPANLFSKIAMLLRLLLVTEYKRRLLATPTTCLLRQLNGYSFRRIRTLATVDPWKILQSKSIRSDQTLVFQPLLGT